MAIPTKLVLSLHNGKSAQPLTSGQKNLVKAQPGEHYRVLRDADGHAQSAGDVLAKRNGEDLQLDYADGTQVVLQEYYAMCKGATACDATLPAPDGASHVVGNDTAGPATADGGILVYAYGSHDTLMAMVQDQPGLSATLGGLPGNEIS
jgi:hypothetical protein